MSAAFPHWWFWTLRARKSGGRLAMPEADRKRSSPNWMGSANVDWLARPRALIESAFRVVEQFLQTIAQRRRHPLQPAFVHQSHFHQVAQMHAVLVGE